MRESAVGEALGAALAAQGLLPNAGHHLCYNDRGAPYYGAVCSRAESVIHLSPGG